jgi:hypothetical protein
VQRWWLDIFFFFFLDYYCFWGCFTVFIPCADKSTVGMFYRQRMLFVDGKYSNEDGMSTGRRIRVCIDGKT